jgi:lipoate-protein ligase A
VLQVVRPTLVLGSAQRFDVADMEAARASGTHVVRRRSGGGAVLLGPDDVLWVDVFVPAGDRLWSPDVGRAFEWLGQAWTDAVGDLGVEGTWHRGAPVATAWSSLVCFAGLGPGEVTVGGAKVVGMSQRRTRAGALFQCGALLGWDPAALVGLLALDAPDRAGAVDELASVAAGLPVGADALERALLDRLSGS